MEDKPWLFRKMDQLGAASGRRAAIRVTIEDWIRWSQYTAHTSKAERDDESKFTNVADSIDAVIDEKCYGNYNELTFCIMDKGAGHCKNIKTKLDKCVSANFK
eukprot:CAMPEP_0114512576 /NCGR_PEP_ID=MMETSP0109-20121206/15057_1 /TAXON_ID=29199 /ORGANISM="Chlorarachnion reptans, Strain CCCM449" /LENGTH=102 /DNA_ID=CAMNT_0001692285 /DNA_START=66 /DNA_END=374 /DNA_ORIENTATION=-